MRIKTKYTDISENILGTIGHTPLVSLNHLCSEYSIRAFAKLESANPGGSIKDRTSYNMLSKAIEKNEVDQNTTIIESSSGNMAIGLAQACLYYNLKLIVVVDPKVNEQTLKLLKTYGAQIEMVKQTDPEQTMLNVRLKRVNELLTLIPNSHWPNQYANPENPRTHTQTMSEIYEALEHKVDYLFVATSTCGTLMGCSDYMRINNYNTKLVAVDAVGSVIFGDNPKPRLIPGHGAGRQSNFLNQSAIDNFINISDLEAVRGCHALLRKEAILAGGSSGAIISAFKKSINSLPADSTCVFILSDTGERYLDTIYSESWIDKHFGPEVTAELFPQLKKQQGMNVNPEFFG